MIETAENLAERYGIVREESDAFALRSQRRAAAAWESGRFDDEVVPVEVPQRRGDPPWCSPTTRGIRGDSTAESLARCGRSCATEQ